MAHTKARPKMLNTFLCPVGKVDWRIDAGPPFETTARSQRGTETAHERFTPSCHACSAKLNSRCGVMRSQ
ncbi:hypothetical protein GCM10022399_11870 [Terrabacter ginsenosidimutans]|uniref:Uncharacterized protein n=1 Tax=Terrabacter ginsenosidimutans TaxID=490575 RepID=A0ABP7CVM3_9MICO